MRVRKKETQRNAGCAEHKAGTRRPWVAPSQLSAVCSSGQTSASAAETITSKPCTGLGEGCAETGEERRCSPAGEQGLLDVIFKPQLGYGWTVNERNTLLAELSHHIMSQQLEILTAQRDRKGAASSSGLACLPRTQSEGFVFSFTCSEKGGCNTLS